MNTDYDYNFYKDLFDQREFNDVVGVANLAIVLQNQKKLEFNPYSIMECFIPGLDVYGLEWEGIKYAIHPALQTLFIFTPENLIN